MIIDYVYIYQYSTHTHIVAVDCNNPGVGMYELKAMNYDSSIIKV